MTQPAREVADAWLDAATRMVAALQRHTDPDLQAAVMRRLVRGLGGAQQLAGGGLLRGGGLPHERQHFSTEFGHLRRRFMVSGGSVDRSRNAPHRVDTWTKCTCPQ